MLSQTHNSIRILLLTVINPLNAELNPICHLLALVEAHPILHVSRVRVNITIIIVIILILYYLCKISIRS